jgi:hypothetical protein
MFKKLFSSKKKASTDELIAAHAEAQQDRLALESEAADLRRSAAISGKDIDSVTADLRVIQTRIEICDAGITEIRDRLTALVASDLERNSRELSTRQAELSDELDAAVIQAGRLYGELMTLLGAIPKGFCNRLHQVISCAIEAEIKGPVLQSEHYRLFAEGMAFAEPNDRDFRSEIAECAAIGAAPEPGSAGFQQKVNLMVGRLLGDEEPREKIFIPMNFPSPVQAAG